MAVEEKAMKRRRTNNNLRSVEQTNDRLSSLHDDLLIVIISCLPLRSAVVTGLLSRRWGGLWKNISSIIISDRTVRKSIYNFVFSDDFLNLMMQIKSPFIHRFHLEFGGGVSNKDWRSPDYSWLRRICDWNVRELKLTFLYISDKLTVTLPSYIFQARSLVSIELDSTFRWELPVGDDSIILPNLKNLTLHFRYSNCDCDCLGKLIKSCPSLEELSLKCIDSWENDYLKCSNQNLRRLFMHCRSGNVKVVIKAPKLEYLDACAPINGVICLDEEPIALREAKLQISKHHHPLDDEKKLFSKFYEAISSVGSITLDIAVLGYISTVFRNVTRLKLNIKTYPDTLIDTNLVLSLLKLCPVLDVITLKLKEGYRHKPWLKLPSHSRRSSTFQRELKRVEVEVDQYDYSFPSKSFVDLVGFLLLSGTINSKHFHFRLRNYLHPVRYCRKETVERIKRMEIDLCRIFHQAPMVSKKHEVEFVGEFYKISRNACRKFSRANREIIYFSCSQQRIED